MNKVSKLLVTTLMVVSPVMFTACGDDNDNTRRDASDVAVQQNRNDQAPSNVKDNYVKENGSTNSNENEEQSSTNRMTTTDSTLNNYRHSDTDYDQLNSRISKLEQEIVDLKSKRVGSDKVGQK